MTSTSAAPTVVVHGATGTQGSAVVRRLLAAGHRVRAAARRPDRGVLPPGVDPVPVDLLDVGSLVRAYDGADAVVVQLPLVFAAERAVPQAEAVLAALAKAQVPRAVFSSGGGPLPPTPIGVPFLDARGTLAAGLADAVGTSAVLVPAAPYLDNLAGPWSVRRVAAGELAYPLPAEASVCWLALDDLAAIIAETVVIADPAPRRFVAGPQALTGDQAAAELGEALGWPVRWTSIAVAEFEQMLAPHLGAEAAAGVAAAYAPPRADAAPPPAPDPRLTVVGPTALRRWATRQTWSPRG